MTSTSPTRGTTPVIIAVAFVAAVAVVVAAIGLADRSSADTAAAPSGTAVQPQLVMVGAGTAHGVPGRLGFSLAVTATRPDVSVALASANASMRKVFAALAGHGVTRRDRATTGLSIDPSYDYGNNTERLVGYTVVQRAKVTVPRLADAGSALSAVATAGGNAVRIHGIRLSFADPAALLAKARKSAMADARAKATEYAGAAGVVLGPVISVKEVGGSTPAVPQAYDGVVDGRALAAGAVPISAGQQDLKVRVRVVWRLH